MTEPATVYSHPDLAVRGGWLTGYPGQPSPDGVRLHPQVLAALCADHAHVRQRVVEQHMSNGDAYADALCEADARYGRLYLTGRHLVYDMRHPAGDSDAVSDVVPDADGSYLLPAAYGLRPVPAHRCHIVRDTNPPPRLVLVHRRDTHSSCDVDAVLEGRAVPSTEVALFDIDPRTVDPRDPIAHRAARVAALTTAAEHGPAAQAAVNNAYAEMAARR
ncbi:hypothetical protein AB0B31_11140 [Catellatospora citrea]|uniref:hypothetical protein n=1 Tax=Catellatospora citrea TaxID=53366 RepID=UPI0033EE0247